tara:strand:+ start:10188 stop:11045 length:858 start_codon:yes stop_codon:yes gene_type:complete
MKILVTGGAGFIGTNLIKRLLVEKHRVVSIDNYDSGLSDNHQKGCTYYNGDISQMQTIDSDALKDIDIVYHLAGLSRIQPSFNNPSNTYNVNTSGTQNVAEWARKNNIKVVYAGSSSRWHDPHQSPYACYKHLGEEILKMYRKVYGLNCEIARFYNVYGPNEIVDGDWAAVIGIWRRQVRDGEKITIVGDGEQRRDFTHVVDIVDGLYKIGMTDKSHDDAWELGTGYNYSINEMCLMFKRKFGTDHICIPDQPGNYRVTLRKNNDARDLLGWVANDRLKEYINSL